VAWQLDQLDMEKVRSIVRTLNFRKGNLQCFKELVRRAPWETALGGRGAEQSQQVFKDPFLEVQELSVPRCKESGKEGNRLA